MEISLHQEVNVKLASGKSYAMNGNSGHTSIQAIFIDPQTPFHKEKTPISTTKKGNNINNQ